MSDTGCSLKYYVDVFTREIYLQQIWKISLARRSSVRKITWSAVSHFRGYVLNIDITAKSDSGILNTACPETQKSLQSLRFFSGIIKIRFSFRYFLHCLFSYIYVINSLCGSRVNIYILFCV